MQVSLPHEAGFNTADNPYTNKEFIKICGDYEVPHDPMRYRDEKFYWTYQHGVGWPDDYIGPDTMNRLIMEKSEGFTNVGLYRISESVRAYAYLILSLQASARSNIIGNMVSALTTQNAFLNNFEDIVNRRVNTQEDIKHHQDTLSYASNEVDYSMGENIYMLPSNMNLNIKTRTARYNNKILISDGKFSLGKNDKVNALELAGSIQKVTKISHKVIAQATTAHGLSPITHEEERAALILTLAVGFVTWHMF